MRKKARKRYTATPTPSCGFVSCQDTITHTPAQSPDSEVNARD